MNKTILKKYAKLIVNMGVNLQKGQQAIVTANVDQRELVEYIVEACYKRGASFVRVDWQDPELVKIGSNYADQNILNTVPAWEEEKLKQRLNDMPCMIYIESDDPDALKGSNVDALNEARRMRYPIIKKYRDQMDNKYQWVIVAAPSVKWAKTVFPGERANRAVDKLWQAILKCARMGDGSDRSAMECDPIRNWEEHNQNFNERSAWLNAQKFDRLIYKSSNGTDFTVGLNHNVKWEGGSEVSLQGITFNPNMPTEEIFTTPMRGRADGLLVSSKPLSYQGQLIEDFSIRFENGRAVEVKAKKGQKLLEEMIKMDEGACYLGEVALVPKNSPINESGILFYTTLFDENAACHVALGAGFSNLLEGYENMSQEETFEAGINQSMIHVDFMIGNDDMSITGVKDDGTQVPVFVNGTWAN
ncbi:MAG: aminopeptidase [Lachnospiraceae bacterium]|nr:aminopeptidase [Lachnospiraceae bacterium]